MQNNIQSTADVLRQKAEELLSKKPSKADMRLSAGEVRDLIHELELHQIELELQNEELRHLWAQTEVVNNKYTGLYDFIPSGYFLLSHEGKIIELNLSGAQMLGEERLRLKTSRFATFLSTDTIQTFNLFLGRAFNSKTKESCEVDLIKPGDRRLVVHLTGIVAENGEQCLVTAVDITDRKMAEEALQKSNKITEYIINNIPVRVFWKDVNLVFQGCNTMFAKDAGFADPKDIIGKDDYMISWSDQADMYRADDQSVIESNCPRLLIEEPQTTPEGNTITLLTSKIPMRNSAGEVIGVLGTYMDITQRKQEENLLAQTRLNYEAFFNTINDFLFVLDEQGNIIHTNNKTIERLGYTREELCGQSILMLHPPERREEAGRVVGEILNGATSVCPVPVITKSGIQIPVDTRVSHGFWDGKPVIFGVTKDISQVRLSEEKFSKLFHINPSACGLSDMENHTYIEVNEAFYTLFGFDKDEVIGKTAMDLGILNPESTISIMQHADSQGNISNAEADLITKNGEIKHVLLSAENIYIQDRKYRFTVVHDITERKHAEQALDAREQQYRDMFFKNTAVKLIIDPTNGAILSANMAAANFYGYSTDRLERMNIKDINTLPADQVQEEMTYASIEQQSHFNFRHLLASGEVRDVEVYSSPIEFGGRKSLYSIVHDVTEQKRVQEELRNLNATLEERVAERTRQLEASNKELAFHLRETEQFTFIASHDLQEPLLTLSNFTDLIREEYAGKLDEIGNKSIEFISSSASRMRMLVKGLLDYSLLGKTSITSVVDCNKVVINVITGLSEVIQKNHAAITVENLPVINGYEAELELLFRHLLINSIIFRKEDVSPEIKISALLEKGEWTFTIQDNGIGIEEKDRDNVFILFKRMHNRNDYSGIGIGLAHCKKIVELHGGKIWVDSAREVGTAIKFAIPFSG
ncbi:MAG: PAS domain S-box protein [Bacteroidetes bacterium]|nr:PAS domain S-box protein [Bacteroidota bacterium]